MTQNILHSGKMFWSWISLGQLSQLRQLCHSENKVWNPAMFWSFKLRGHEKTFYSTWDTDRWSTGFVKKYKKNHVIYIYTSTIYQTATINYISSHFTSHKFSFRTDCSKSFWWLLRYFCQLMSIKTQWGTCVTSSMYQLLHRVLIVAKHETVLRTILGTSSLFDRKINAK